MGLSFSLAVGVKQEGKGDDGGELRPDNSWSGLGNMLPRRDWRDWKIAIVESDKFGGTCLNRGCIPSKMLIYAAEVAETIRKAGHYGVNAHIDGIDWTRVSRPCLG